MKHVDILKQRSTIWQHATLETFGRVHVLRLIGPPTVEHGQEALPQPQHRARSLHGIGIAAAARSCLDDWRLVSAASLRCARLS